MKKIIVLFFVALAGCASNSQKMKEEGTYKKDTKAETEVYKKTSCDDDDEDCEELEMPVRDFHFKSSGSRVIN